MKAKEAIEQLKGLNVLEKDFQRLYDMELNGRMKLRFKSGIANLSSFRSLANEMEDWIFKVMRGCGITKERAKEVAGRFSAGTDKAAVKAAQLLANERAKKERTENGNSKVQ